ncbi:unnamed protein product, partial [Ixodes persulcatus]
SPGQASRSSPRFIILQRPSQHCRYGASHLVRGPDSAKRGTSWIRGRAGEAPARAPHDLTEDPTYTSRATHGKANPKLHSNGASRSWSVQWAARFAVIMAALGNWVSSTRVSWPSQVY